MPNKCGMIKHAFSLRVLDFQKFIKLIMSSVCIMWPQKTGCLSHASSTCRYAMLLQLQCRPTLSLQVQSVLTVLSAHRVCVLWNSIEIGKQLLHYIRLYWLKLHAGVFWSRKWYYTENLYCNVLHRYKASNMHS